MIPFDVDSRDREQHLTDVLVACLEAADNGEPLGPEELRARYPELAPELDCFLAGQDAVCRLAAPLRQVAQVASTVAKASDDTVAVASKPASDLQIGSFGDYELLDEIGQGGMGVVFKARQKSLNRLVALKVLRAGPSFSPAELERFRNEAEMVAQLDHPHIVPIYEVGQQHAQHYFSMKLVEGGSLAQRIGGRGQGSGISKEEEREAARLMATVARAVHYAHQRGILHRDLKPSNILLEQVEGRESRVESQNDIDQAKGTLALDPGPSTLVPKVIDFGLAKRLEADSSLTQSGVLVGTPSYMAPEQALGRAGQITTATDVFGLGGILYALLTGRPPFRGETILDTLALVRESEPVRPRVIHPSVDRDLETICLKCLHKEPSRRYGSADALADELERWLAGEPIAARPVGRVDRAWRWCRRNPRVAILTAAVFVSLMAGTTVSTFFAVRASDRARLAEKNADWAQQEQRTAYRRLYVSDMRLAQKAWEDGRIARLRELLEGQRPERTEGIDLRGFEWYYWHRLCDAAVATLQAHTGWATDVILSPDGKQLLSASSDRSSAHPATLGEIKIWDIASGRELLRLDTRHPWITGVACNQPRQRFAVASSDFKANCGTIQIRDWPSGKDLLTIESPHAMAGSLAFSPDGELLAGASNPSGDLFSATKPGTVKVWDAATGQELLNLTGHGREVGAIAFSPDGQLLASVAGDGLLKVWDKENGKEKIALAAYPPVAFSPDGKYLGAGYPNNEAAKVWDTANWQERFILKGHAHNVLSLAFSPDSQRIATGSRDQTVKVWNAATGTELYTLKGHTDAVSSVAFSPSGDLIASGGGDGSIKLWNESSGREALVIQGGVGRLNDLDFGPDGDRVVAAGWSHSRARIWEAATGKELLTFEGHTNRVHCTVFSPDGHNVASSAYPWPPATGDGPGEVIIWDATIGSVIHTLSDRWLFVRYSPDGKRLVTAGNYYAPDGDCTGKITVWDLADTSIVFTIEEPGRSIGRIAFSPDGRWIASISVGESGPELWEVTVRDATTGHQLQKLSGTQNWPGCVTLSNDSSHLATGHYDGSIKLWDAASGTEVRTFKGHRDAVARVVFSPDGKRIASASGDRTVRLWDTSSGQELLILSGHTDAIASVAFSPDGWRLASAAGDGTVRIWDARPWGDQ